MKRVMWIEDKTGNSAGCARIGWVEVKNKGKKIEYDGRSFQRQRDGASEANFFEVECGDRYWISGCHKDGRDALYATAVEVDENALEEYWINIRKLPENVKMRKFTAHGKY